MIHRSLGRGGLHGWRPSSEWVTATGILGSQQAQAYQPSLCISLAAGSKPLQFLMPGSHQAQRAC